MPSRKKKPRARTERRRRQRELDKLYDQKEKLARLSPGGSPELPLELQAASVVELTAQRLGCARCDAETAIEEHVAEAGMRRVRTRCKRCGHRRDVWIRLAARMLS